jgi:anti-sigma factor RsiW
MKCEDVSKELIAYLDRRTNSAERTAVEMHLRECTACHARAEEFRKLWNVLDEVPVHEPSFAFDARLRQRIAAEPRRRWFTWLVPQPRLALTMAMLVALSIWMARLPKENANILGSTMQAEDEQFQVIKDLGVLENYDMLSKSDALSELPPMAAPQPVPPEKEAQREDGGL